LNRLVIIILLAIGATSAAVWARQAKGGGDVKAEPGAVSHALVAEHDKGNGSDMVGFCARDVRSAPAPGFH
jgi:hypothetical protein